ncbi:MAG: surface lipoprotein assembly modifier [Paracoccaceae bacterium]|nr:surface lipoprotein assembly modifier [Paracoccaceae bacterium]
MLRPEPTPRGLLRQGARAALVALALWALPVRAEDRSLTDLTIPQLQRLATALATAGQDAAALRVTEVLLLRTPDDPLGHYVVGLVMLRAGQTQVARIASRRSFAAAGTERQHYEAARLAAKVAVADHRWINAQYWARQTIQYAPDTRYRDLAVQDFKQLRAISPLDWGLRLGLRPSNNANGGADERLNIIDGYDAVGYLSDDAMALPGLVGTASFDIGYRLGRTPDSETRIGLSTYVRAVELEGHPVALPPPGSPPGSEPTEISNADYSAAALGISLTHNRALGGYGLGAKLSVGQVWQGGDAAYHYAGLDLNGARRLGTGPTAPRLSFGISAEARARDDAARTDVRRTLSLGYAQPVNSGRITAGVTLSALHSGLDNARYWSVSGTVQYEPDLRLGPLAVSVGAGLSRTVYPDYTVLIFHPDGGRQDNTVFAELGLWAPALSYAGFAPELKLQTVVTDSNISRFESNEIAVAVGLRSTF